MSLLIPIRIDEQIKAVERELVMRRRVYPRLVAGKTMSQNKANGEIAAMEAVLETLRRIAGEKA